MLNVIKEQKGNVLVVRFTGSIEENVNFEALIGTPPEELHVYCKEVPRINSIGVKAWIRFFQSLKAKGIKLKFFECSTAIVQQINLISNFTPPRSVESIYVPFTCMQCKSELVGLFKCEDLKQMKLKIPDLKCAKCGGRSAFDDIPEEFFAFLFRN
ncbi:MAG: hypothetical protein HY072_07615 [Deltaproteobacteria bacterium]|nr:hypothetical protein [Deltaproteobacteria bacterium]MBI4925111.1 hypothetical protein [Bdellovibrio sp.]